MKYKIKYLGKNEWMACKEIPYTTTDEKFYRDGRVYTLRGLIDFMRGNIKNIDEIEFSSSITTDMQRDLSAYFKLLKKAYEQQ